jgi:hypothetical protein
VESIGRRGFLVCLALRYVDFSDDSHIRRIGPMAFASSGLRYLFVPQGVEALDGSALEDLDSLDLSSENVYFDFDDYILFDRNHQTVVRAFDQPAVIYMDDSIENIGRSAFSRIEGLSQICFGEDSRLKRLEQSAFSYSSLAKIRIPRTCEILEENCFGWCECLRKVRFEPDSVCRALGDSAFSGTQICKIEIPRTVEVIGKMCFAGCRKLTEFEFEDDSNLARLEERAFADCPIVMLTLPRRLQFVDGTALEGMEIGLESDQEYLVCDGRFLFNRDRTVLIRCLEVEPVTVVPMSVQVIGKGAFSKVRHIDEVVFCAGSNVSKIGDVAFRGSSLARICIPKTVTSLGKDCFASCARLEQVNLEKGSPLPTVPVEIEIPEIVPRPFNFPMRLNGVAPTV